VLFTIAAKNQYGSMMRTMMKPIGPDGVGEDSDVASRVAKVYAS
jgi:hypothetical protein